MRLDDGRVNLDRGGPARRDEHRRPAGREPDPDCEEGRRALVQAHVQRDPARHARAPPTRGVEREPGATTASVSPARTHSSTSVAAKLAATVTSRCPPRAQAARRPGRPGCTRPGQGAGPRVVLVHGFTQTSSLVATHRARARRRLRGRDARPSRPRPLPGARTSARGSPRPPRPRRGRRARRATSGYSLGGRCCLHLALQSPRLVERLVIVGAHPGIGDEPSRRLRRQADETRRGRARTGRRRDRGGVRRGMARRTALRPPDRGAGRPARRASPTPPRAWPPRFERLAPAHRRLFGIASASSRCRSWSSPERSTTSSAALRSETVDAIGHNARLALVAGAGHAVASSALTLSSRSCGISSLDAMPPGSCRRGSKCDPQGKQGRRRPAEAFRSRPVQ